MRPAPRIKFIWGAAGVIRGRWRLGLFGFYDRVEGVPDSGLAISLRGVLAWSAVLGALAYVALASAVFHVWSRNPHNRLTYADAVLYPLRRASIAEKKGQAFIAQGMEFFQQQKFGEAANLLRLGLARAPGDTAARTMLAQFYLMANQRPLAVRVLQEGLTEEYPGRPVLQTLFAAAEQAEDYALVADVTARYLAPGRIAAEAVGERRWLSERRFVALTNLGKHEEALALADDVDVAELALEFRVVALLGLWRAGEALVVLDEAETRGKTNRAAVLRLKVRSAREAQQPEAMDRALAELQSLSPAEPAARVYGVVQRAMAGRASEARAALEDYIFRFGGDVGNLVLVAEPLGQVGDVALLDVCIVAAKEQGFPLARFQPLLVEALLQHGDWTRAASVLAEIPPKSGREALLTELWREWVGKIVEVVRTPTGGAQLALVDFLRQRAWPAAVFRKTLDALEKAGRTEAERDVLALATRAFPASAWFAAEAEKAARAEVNATTGAAVTGNGAETDGLELASELRDGDAYSRRLDALVAAGKWSDAAEFLQAAMAAKPLPEWLDARRSAALRLAQVRVSHSLGDTHGMLAATRLFLNGDDARSQQIVDLAQAIAAQGDKDAALALAREVLRRAPDFAPARRAIVTLQPAGQADAN